VPSRWIRIFFSFLILSPMVGSEIHNLVAKVMLFCQLTNFLSLSFGNINFSV